LIHSIVHAIRLVLVHHSIVSQCCSEEERLNLVGQTFFLFVQVLDY